MARGRLPRPSLSRQEKFDGGNDTFPLWESCLLRPTFATIYRDWENGAAQFPALGDAPSSDPSDPDAPAGSLLLAAPRSRPAASPTSAQPPVHGQGHRRRLRRQPVAAQYRFYKAGSIPGAWHDIAANGTFSIPAGSGDGTYTVQMRTADPCHTFDESDTLPAGAAVTRSVFLDTTPPEITVTKPSPEGVLFDSDDFSAIEYTVTDAGSGVDAATVKATFDGAPATHGQVLDMFLLAPGNHAVKVAAATTSATRPTRPHVRTARDVGEPAEQPRGALHRGADRQGRHLQRAVDKLEHALGKHDDGQHDVEHDQLGALINQVEAQRGSRSTSRPRTA